MKFLFLGSENGFKIAKRIGFSISVSDKAKVSELFGQSEIFKKISNCLNDDISMEDFNKLCNFENAIFQN